MLIDAPQRASVQLSVGLRLLLEWAGEETLLSMATSSVRGKRR